MFYQGKQFLNPILENPDRKMPISKNVFFKNPIWNINENPIFKNNYLNISFSLFTYIVCLFYFLTPNWKNLKKYLKFSLKQELRLEDDIHI